MAHFAKIDSQTNVVIEVNVVNNEDINNLEFPDSEPVGIIFLQPWNTEGTYWKQTSYNNNFRGHYACIGDTYDAEKNAFVAPKPFNSWVLNTTTFYWGPPIPYPEDGSMYVWNETTVSWVPYTPNT